MSRVVILFDTLKFLRSTELREYYTVLSATSPWTIDIEYEKHQNWFYTDINRPDMPNHNITSNLMNHLRFKLINHVKFIKSKYYAIAYKNLNFIRNELHPDILPIIVNLIHNLRQPHPLESQI